MPEDACPEAFARAAEEAAPRWRFYPVRVEKAVVVADESCPEAAARNSETAGMKWRFESFLLDGEPVRVLYLLKINFMTS